MAPRSRSLTQAEVELALARVDDWWLSGKRETQRPQHADAALEAIRTD